MTQSVAVVDNPDMRSEPKSHPPARPEAGSEHGVHLRGGAFRGSLGIAAPEGFLVGGLYCVYPRAFSADGRLDSLLPELDRIADLGCTALWFLPLHPVGLRGRKGSRGSPYSIRDYRGIDPEYGSAEDFARVVRAAQDRGFRVILDFVANHAANDHPAMLSHPEWFAWDETGNPARRVADWSDITDWRHDAPGASEHLLQSAVKWVEETGLDGFRCDVAGMLPRAFWVELRARLAATRPGRFLLAEWQDPALNATAFHACYDWGTYRSMRDMFRGEGDARGVCRMLASWDRHFPARAIPLRFLENHDEPRVLSLLDSRRLPAFAAVTILSGGLPLIYNGQEIGETHRPSLFEAEPIAWSGRDDRVAAIYRGLLRLHRAGPPWNVGEICLVETDRPREAAAFVRPGSPRGLVVANLGANEIRVRPRLRFREEARYHRSLGSSGRFDPGDVLRLEPGEAWIGETRS